MGSLGAGALLGAACVRQQRLPGASVSAAWTLAPVLKNPNSPIVMVDQMRVPVWLSHGQMNRLSRSIPPNIMGRIQANSYNFGQHFCAATNCTSSWPALLTGLYLPQTAPCTILAIPLWEIALSRRLRECLVVRQVASLGKSERGAPGAVRTHRSPVSPVGDRMAT
jgi:hypothetical protein